jgi:Zn-dependent protease
MILSELFSNPIAVFTTLILIIISIGVHEAAHAFAAYKLGDPTPKIQGRLTLNPLKHIDPIGLLFIAVAGMGWGKPVEFNPYNLKDPKRDTALIAVAGPISNILLALASYGVMVVLFLAGIINLNDTFLFGLLLNFIVLNISLTVFNLIPIDPLDGFKIVGGLLPNHLAMKWYETQQYGIYVLLILLATGSIKFIIDPVNYFIIDLFFQHFKSLLAN